MGMFSKIGNMFGFGGGGGPEKYTPKVIQGPGYYSGINKQGNLGDEFSVQRDPDAEWAQSMMGRRATESYQPPRHFLQQALQDYDTAAGARMNNMSEGIAVRGDQGTTDEDVALMKRLQQKRNPFVKGQITNDFRRQSTGDALRHALGQEQAINRLPQMQLQGSWADSFNRGNFLKELQAENKYKADDYNRQIKHTAAIEQANAMGER